MNVIPRPTDYGNGGYPTSDGKPMAETERHRNLMMALIQTLERHFADDPDVTVSGNLLLFYAEGDHRRHVSPDVFVARGVPRRERQNYLVWREGKGPDLVIELTSSTTRREDSGRKLELYRDVLGVREYFLFDPYGDWLNPVLQGHRLNEGRYEPVVPNAAGRLVSEVLGLELATVDGEPAFREVGRGQRRRRVMGPTFELRLFDPATGRILPTPTEAERAAREAERRAQEAAEAERRGRETAEEAAQAERRARVAEQQARETAEAEIERLRHELDELRRRGG
jgi:Uma2 family endonuclease